MPTLFRQRSELQDIELFVDDDGYLGLTLDGYWQFSAKDEARFHEALVEPAMCMAEEPRRVLILGGGDGLAARNVLRHPGVQSVTVCEIDPVVIELAENQPELSALNEHAFADPRVEVIPADATEVITFVLDTWDVIIIDFPAPIDPLPTPLFNRHLYRSVLERLTRGGIASIQVSLEPPEFWDALAEAGAAFPWTQPRLVELGEDTWATSILGARGPRSPRRALPPGLECFRAEHLEGLVIHNREGDRFHTTTYGDRPDFRDPLFD